MVNNVIVAGQIKGVKNLNEKMAFVTLNVKDGKFITTLDVTLSGPMALRANALSEGDGLIVQGRLESHKRKDGSEAWGISQVSSVEKGDKGFVNLAILQGRLTADPVILKDDCGMRMTVAVSRYYKKNGEFIESTSFIPVVIWNCDHRNLKKGSPVWIYGSIKNHSYDTKNGEKRYSVQVVASEIRDAKMDSKLEKKRNIDDLKTSMSGNEFESSMKSFDIQYADNVQDCPLPY